jgi:hypothetical protein
MNEHLEQPDRWPALDLRSLALLRIACAVICVFDIANRAFALRAQYTSEGVLPLRNYLWQPDMGWRIWSVYYLGDSPFFVGCLFALTVSVALALAAGYRTAWASLGLWVMLLSLHHRNILVINGGDHYLRMLVFWGIFLPWGARFSWDAAASRAKGDPPSNPTSFPAGAAYLIQICIVYLSNALYKSGPAWKSDGTAIHQALGLADIGNGVAQKLLGLGSLLVPATFAVWYFELLIPLALLLPFPRLRLTGVAALAAFHLGILATMRVELFSIVSIIALLGLVPSLTWDTARGNTLQAHLNSCFTKLHLRLPNLPLTTTTTPAVFGKLRQGFVLLATLFVVFQSTHDYLTDDRWKDHFVSGRALGLYVKWAMFAPGPPNDSWQSAPAVTASGRQIDLLTSRPPSMSKLKTTIAYERAGRWKSYRSGIQSGNFGSNAQAYLDFLVKRWDATQPADPITNATYQSHSETSTRGYRLPQVKTRVEAFYFKPTES